MHNTLFLLRVFEHVDACEDLECGSQFNVHGAHEVVLLQQEQGLSVNLLRAKLVCYLLTTWQRTDELVNFFHVPLGGVVG